MLNSGLGVRKGKASSGEPGGQADRPRGLSELRRTFGFGEGAVERAVSLEAAEGGARRRRGGAWWEDGGGGREGEEPGWGVPA